AVAEDPESRQRLAYRGFHRAEVLAHHHYLIANAFQREDADEVLAQFADVRPAGGIGAIGYPEEAEEAHHMVDAQGATVAAVLADRLGEQPVAIFAVTL